MCEQSVEKPEVLVVDDSKVIRMAAGKMLGKDYVIHLAEDGLAGWEMLQQNTAISVVFTDLSMPNMNGMELLGKIRGSEESHIVNVPVIIMTGNDDTESMKKSVFDAGATDFITKPFQSIDLISRAKSYARLSQKVGELEMKTGHDKLTGLYNTHSLHEQGLKALSFSNRHKLAICAVYFEIMDFEDRFLSHGKKVAQHVIIAVGRRLQEVMREEDIAARIGVAKYALILPMTDRQQAEIVIERIRSSINRLAFDTGKEKIRVTLATGYTAPGAGNVIEFAELLSQADNALQLAKSSPVNQLVSYKEEDAIKPETDISELDIKQALENIIAGNFYQIPGHLLTAVVDRLRPFMQYAENQHEADPD